MKTPYVDSLRGRAARLALTALATCLAACGGSNGSAPPPPQPPPAVNWDQVTWDQSNWQ
jgi:hypothetical protein